MGVAIMVFLVPLIVVFIKNRPEDIGLKPDGGWKPTGEAAARAPRVTDESWSLREALRTRTLWAMMGVFVFGGSTVALNGSVLAPYLIQVHGLTSQQVGWVISMFWVPASISRVIWGLLVDRLPPRVCLFTVTIFRATGPFALALLPFPLNLGVWMFCSGLIGNAYGILQPVMFGNYFGRKSFATIQGGVRPFMALPGMVIPLILARLYDMTGSFTWGFLFSGTVGMVGVACTLFAGAPKKKTSPPAEQTGAPVG
jgi:sugar phosphate permease